MTDAVAVFPPGFRVTDSNGDPVSGAKIKFYAATTTTPRTVYSDSGLTQSLGATVYCGSDGFPVASQGSSTEVMVYTGTTAYKVVVTDSSDVEIATFDNLSGALDTSGFLTTDSVSTLSLPVVTKTSNYTIVAGDNGKVINANSTSGDITLTFTSATTLGDGFNVEIKHAGTANNVILSTSQTFAYAGTTSTTYILTVGETAQVVCDTAGFHIINAIPIPLLPPPQGYLTLSSATPIITGDVTAATSVYYAPYVGNIAPIWNGARFVPATFTELTLSLSASHAANALYDVFLFSDSGTLRIVTGPAWTTATAGSGARGTGAGTTQLSRVSGFWSNTVAMTARNGASTYSVAAGYGTYIGTIAIDGTQGQVSCHRTYGQSRRWGVWNTYNRRPVIVKAGDATSSWNYGSTTIRAANGSSANAITIVLGLQEEMACFDYTARVVAASGLASGSVPQFACYVGYNSTTAGSGQRGFLSSEINGTISTFNAGGTIRAAFHTQPAIGLHTITALEASLGSGTMSVAGTEAMNLLTASFMA